MDMIDRGAAAILRAIVGGGDEIWNSLPKKSRDYYRVQSRAVIEAMRDPTEGMAAGIFLLQEPEHCEERKAIYRSMIDAALTPSLDRA